LGIRSRLLARRGKYADASATAEKLAALEPVNGENLFQAAEGYALCADPKEPASSPAKTAVGDLSLKSESAARAIEFLKQAYAAGYFQYAEKRAKLYEDRNLDAIRSLDNFKTLVAEISRVAALQRPPIFTKWTYRADERGDGGSFEMTESDWVELKNGKVYAHFALTESTNDYVELYDKSRKLWVRLTQTTESYSTDQKNWHAIITGTPVHEGASHSELSRLSPPATDRPKSD
jgi:hypothetical protein